MAQIIDGRSIAAARKEQLKQKSQQLRETLGRSPTLAVILVGEDPASQTYVRFKMKMCDELSITSQPFFLDASITQHTLNSLITQLNNDTTIDGILLQLPLPPALNTNETIELISPSKDVDGLHPYNQGLLMQGHPSLVPCTPQGCLQLIQSCHQDLTGAHAVIVGRSVLVGRPLALLLLNQNMTVTIAHSKTRNLKTLCQTADVLVGATGSPHLITADYVKPGAIVIDVGQSRQNSIIQGDVDFDSVAPLAGYITPVPGGVGPMTIINLMENLLHAASVSLNQK